MNFENLMETGLKLADNKSTFVSPFYKLEKTDGNGAAIIRILPDPECQVIVCVRETTARINEQKWYSGLSLINLGQKDPFNEVWEKLWHSNNKDEARKFKSVQRYVFNALIVKDPGNPENEGTVQLVKVNASLYEKIMSICKGDDMTEPVDLFHPIKGWDFKLIAKKESSGFTSYSDSAPLKQREAFKDAESAAKFIKEKCTPLSSLLKPSSEFYPYSYQELSEKLYELTDGAYGVSSSGDPAGSKDSEDSDGLEDLVSDDISSALKNEESKPQETKKASKPKKVEEDKVGEVDPVDALLADL